MRAISIYILLLTLCVLSPPAHGQSLDQQRITLSFTGKPLKDLLNVLNVQLGMSFACGPGCDILITVNANNATAAEVLDAALENTGYTYRIKRKSITITPDSRRVLAAAHLSRLAISGIVTDASSQHPLTAVNILVKGTTHGTITNTAGRYLLEVSPSDTLIISFVGYKHVEIPVGQRTTIDVALNVHATTLNEVVISTGYYETTKEESTMNIAKVTRKGIERQPVTNPMNAVVGQMAGVDITPVNGAPGVALRVQIRGNNSLRAGGEGTYPLLVIDGIQVESQAIPTYSGAFFGPGFDPISTINPMDIESIEVLKDAAATAIYGSRGANGVIRITTKRAVPISKSALELRAYTGIGQATRQLELLDTRQYIQMRREAQRNSGITTPAPNDWDLNGTWDDTQYTDFQKELIGNKARITDIYSSISGGNGLSGVRLQGGYHKEGAIYPGDFSMERITAGLSFSHTSTDEKFNAQSSVHYGWVNNRSAGDLGFVYSALTLPPVAPSLRDKNGNINFGEVVMNGTTIPTFNNPRAALLKTDHARSNHILSNTLLSYEIAKGLVIKNSLSLQYFVNTQVTKDPVAAIAPSIRGATTTGSAIFTGNTRTSLMVEPQVTYHRNFSDHHLSTVVGCTWQNRNAIYQVDAGSGYTSDELLNSLQGAQRMKRVVDDNIQYRYASGYARIGYNFRKKYFIDLTGRRDGSSRFSAGKKYGNFWAVSGAWIFSNEHIIQENLSFLSFGKIRGSYGITGNDQIPDYQYFDTYSQARYSYQGTTPLVPTLFNNPNYAWETTAKKEIAIELGFFEDRVSLEAAWYHNRSSRQLVTDPLPATAGLPNVIANIDAIIENTGTEIVIHTRNITHRNFQWSTAFNLTHPKNKLDAFPDLEISPYARLYEVGQSLAIQHFMTYKGIDPQTGNYIPPDISDRNFVANTGRRYYGGLSNTFTCRNFELSLLFQFSKALISGFLIHPAPGSLSNQPVSVMNRWQTEGDITTEPKFTADLAAAAYYQTYVMNSSRNTAMVTFVRLKTASLSYRLPTTLTSRASMSNAQIFVQTQNLFTLTRFNDALDPETGNALPPLKIINIGLQLNP